MRVVTLNVRNPSSPDGEHAWPHRRVEFFETLRRLEPEVLCLQETIVPHVEEILDELPRWAAYCAPREADGTGETCAILWNVASPEVSPDTQWLSETPDVPGSLGWDAVCPRVVSWVDFGDWAILNTHLDHVGLEARRNGMAQVIARANALAKPCLIVGDLNATPDEPPLELARAAGFVDLARDAGPTFHGFVGGARPLGELAGGIERIRQLARKEADPERRRELLVGADGIDGRRREYEALWLKSSEDSGELTRIDYILARGPWRCERAWVERGDYSDHWAVAADLEL